MNNFSNLSNDELNAELDTLKQKRRRLVREIDELDSEIIGLKEELKKRPEELYFLPSEAEEYEDF